MRKKILEGVGGVSKERGWGRGEHKTRGWDGGKQEEGVG